MASTHFLTTVNQISVKVYPLGLDPTLEVLRGTGVVATVEPCAEVAELWGLANAQVHRGATALDELMDGLVALVDDSEAAR